MLAVVSSNAARGYESNFVTELRARKSTQNLNFGLPSGLRLGTRIAGADHGDVPYRNIFSTWAFISSRKAKGLRY